MQGLKELCEIAGLNWHSQAQTRVAEESQAECGVTADAVKSVFCDVSNLGDRVGAQIGNCGRFEVTPDALDRD
jgi:hypothetical protein